MTPPAVSPAVGARILGLRRDFDVDTFPVPPDPFRWTTSGMLVGPAGMPSPAVPDGLHFRLEGTVCEGGLLEWVGHAGWPAHAWDMARWLVAQGLAHTVVIVTYVGEVRA
jgi:hypothetical protein